MPNGKGSGTEQTQQVTQSTSVTVQNVIEAPQLEPLQRVKLLADIFGTLDQAQRPQGPQTVVIAPPAVPVASIFNNPNTLALLIAAGFGLVIVAKKLR